jgi:diadenosine tetraphosphate (Ap4A) HIT family hydrolase
MPVCSPKLAEDRPMECELCKEQMTLFGDQYAYVRYDNNSLSKGHVIVVPRRHVADFFDMTPEEKSSVITMLDRAKAEISREHSPDGYNIGVNIGKAAGQSRMHVHVHLIPRYSGDVADPSGGIRCVLAKGK